MHQSPEARHITTPGLSGLGALSPAARTGQYHRSLAHRSLLSKNKHAVVHPTICRPIFCLLHLHLHLLQSLVPEAELSAAWTLARRPRRPAAASTIASASGNEVAFRMLSAP